MCGAICFLPPPYQHFSRQELFQYPGIARISGMQKKPPQRVKYEKTIEFYPHFINIFIQKLLLIEVLFTVFCQGREDSIAVSVFVDISIEFDKSDGKLQINTLILSDEEPCLSPVCVSALSSLLRRKYILQFRRTTPVETLFCQQLTLDSYSELCLQ